MLGMVLNQSRTLFLKILSSTLFLTCFSSFLLVFTDFRGFLTYRTGSRLPIEPINLVRFLKHIARTTQRNFFQDTLNTTLIYKSFLFLVEHQYIYLNLLLVPVFHTNFLIIIYTFVGSSISYNFIFSWLLQGSNVISFKR